MKNECGKTVKINEPYEIWRDEIAGWEWRVLKKYQADDNKMHARWLCAVKSPYTFGSYEMGDTYVTSVKDSGGKKVDLDNFSIEEW